MLRTLLAVCLTLVTASAAAEFRIAAAKMRLEFELMDGSRVCGDAVEAEPVLRLGTALGEVRVPLVQLSRVELLDDHEQAIVHFANGDRLKGRLSAGIEVNTLLGKLCIPLKTVRTLRVLPANSKRLQPVAWPRPESAVDVTFAVE